MKWCRNDLGRVPERLCQSDCAILFQVGPTLDCPFRKLLDEQKMVMDAEQLHGGRSTPPRRPNAVRAREDPVHMFRERNRRRRRDATFAGIRRVLFDEESTWSSAVPGG